MHLHYNAVIWNLDIWRSDLSKDFYHMIIQRETFILLRNVSSGGMYELWECVVVCLVVPSDSTHTHLIGLFPASALWAKDIAKSGRVLLKVSWILNQKFLLSVQSFTLLLWTLMADLCQDVNTVSSFRRCLYGTLPWRNCSV